MLELEIKDRDILKLLNLFGIKNKHFRRVVAGFESFFERVEHHHVFLISAGIAFNILLYLIPLLLIAIYFVNVVFEVGSVSSFLETALEGVLPPHNKTFDFLKKTIEEVNSILTGSSIAGWIGIISLLWLSSTLLSSLRTGLNRIFRIPSPYIFFIYKIKDIFLIVAIALLVLLASFIFPIITIAEELLSNSLPSNVQSIFSIIYSTLFSIVSSVLLFYLLFRFVPNKKTNRFVRFLSIGISVVFIEISRFLFAWYISGVTAYGLFYGTYAILASIALWVYYFVLIIMFSAEFSQFVFDMRRPELVE
ncbi:MAG: YihY/virulence factor BrkB family protein [Bacteroidetes bacterium]|nr:MAG: YihY/virulence factor BrkB family protein [Bacteroidota bacterium]